MKSCRTWKYVPNLMMSSHHVSLQHRHLLPGFSNRHQWREVVTSLAIVSEDANDWDDFDQPPNPEELREHERDITCTLNCLCQVLVMLLSLCEGLWALPGARLRPMDPRAEFDSIVNLARNLLGDTKTLYNHFKNRYPAEGEHKLETLPVLSMNAVELANIQVSGGLARLSSDLHCYQRHFEWLRKAAPLLLRPMEHDISTVHSRLERLLKRLEHLMAKLSLTRSNDPQPTLPASHVTHWSVVQAGHAIIHSFHLYLDWAARVLVLIRNKL